MPTLAIAQRFPCEQEVLFAFFQRPVNVVATAPEEMNLHLVEGPEVVTLGSRVVVQVRRWGLSMYVTSEIVDMIEPERIVEEQRQGPFRLWRHERRFSKGGENETILEERIDYEPPRGILGLTLTARRIEEQFKNAYVDRVARILQLLGAKSS